METAELVAAQRTYFQTNKTKSVAWRIEKLRALQSSIRAHEADILAALESDLGKVAFEGYVSEVGMVLQELSYALKHVRVWSRPRHVSTELTNFLSSSKILYEPYGVVLIMAPWNYPFLLSLDPVIGAVAAGNCVIVKPSAYSPATSDIIKVIIEEVFEPENGAVVLGGRAENAALLEQEFDYIFFTGSTAVGHVVMEAASKYLTPISLELGGKSPCIVDETASIDLAAKRIVWGKFLNAGQTCIAPDYIYAHVSIKDELIAAMKRYIVQFYGEHPLQNSDLPRIVNEKHFARLKGLVAGETPAIGGHFDDATLKVEPSIYDNMSWDAPLMGEEIFGPLMPVLTFDSLDEVIGEIKKRNRPLALYLFTTSSAHEEKVMREVAFGGGCINDTIVHIASTSMPFGGVGASGMGGYHGVYSFETFSHRKSVLKKSNLIDMPIRYAPYKKSRLGLIKKLMR